MTDPPKCSIVFYDLAFENLGVQILSSYLTSQGHDVVVLNEPDKLNPLNLSVNEYKDVEDAVDKILAHVPKVAAFSVFTHNYRAYRRIATRLKQKCPEIVIVFGGIHVTLLKEKILTDDWVDFAVYGEGEMALDELLRAVVGHLPHQEIKNLIYRESSGAIHVNPCRPYLRDLDKLPFPDKSVYIAKNPFLKIRYHISASRGCQFACTYCSNDGLHKLYGFEKNHIRMRSPANVLEEIEEAVKKYDCKLIYFVDEIFTYNTDWLCEFSRGYVKRIDLPIECITHPSYITEEKADILKTMNTQVVSIGVQNADENFRRSILNRFERNTAISRSIFILRQRKIKIAIDHILGLPGETIESIKYSIECYARWQANYISINWLAYYPSLTICQHAINNQTLSQEDLRRIELGEYDFNYKTLPKEKRLTYMRLTNLLNCIGILPSYMIIVAVRHLEYVPAGTWIATVATFLSRFILQRKSWAWDYIIMLIRMRFGIGR